MANTFNQGSNTWQCDATGVLTTERVKVKSVRWTGQGAADVLLLSDANAEGWLGLKGTENDEQLVDAWINGITVTTIGAGVCYITFA